MEAIFMQSQKTKEILERLPEIYKQVAGQKVKLPDGSQAIIKCRVNNLTKKPPLYMWNLTSHCYVSSLKLVQEEQGKFMFDIRHGEETQAYNLFWKIGTLKIEELVAV